MEITYLVIIMIVTYALGAITKVFIDSIPNRYIPLQNLVIGIISAIVCFVFGIETNLLNALVLCIMATMGAGGLSNLINLNKK